MTRALPPLRRRAPAPSGLLVASLVAALAGACVPVDTATSAPPVGAAPTAATPAIGTTTAALEATFRSASLAIAPAARAYRPSEPSEASARPRSVLQIVLPQDPDAGYVVVYDAGDPGSAGTLGQAFAGYLASGFGQTNYPADARFSLATYGPTLVFGWWSPGASHDAASVEAAYRVLSSFGSPIPVVR